MKFINKFFIGLMALTLATTVLAFTLDQTILRPEFVTAQLDKSGVYTDLSATLSKQLASNGDNNSGGSGNSPQIQAALERTLTPSYLQTNLDTYITNFLGSVKNGGTIPALDLTSVIPKIEAMGVSLTPKDKAQLTKNLTIDPSVATCGLPCQGEKPSTPSDSQGPNVSKVYHKASQGKWLLVLATLILAALVFVTAPRHRLKALGHGFIGATFWIGIYYLFFRLAPGIADHQLKTAKDVSISSSVSRLVTLAASGVAQHLLYAGAVTLAIGVLLWVVSMFMPHFGGGKPTKGDKTDQRTPLPSLFHKS